MDIFTRQRLTGWIIGILVLLNLTTLGVLWYRESIDPAQFRQAREDQFRQKQEERFKNELGLDQNQIRLFNENRSQFFSLVKPEKKKIHEMNKEIMNQAFSEQPDMTIVQEKATQIGETESQLALLFFKHLTDLKQIARPQQQEKVHQFFQELFNHARPPGPPPDEMEPKAEE